VIAVPTKSTKQENVYPYQEETRSTTEIERKLEDLLGNMKSVGKVQVMITCGNDEQVEGIAVLADGAGNGVVVREITSVVQALFDVDSHKIKVIERNQNN
jgi:stage III sporulation protein AG